MSRGLEVVSCHFKNGLLILASLLYVDVAQQAAVVRDHFLDGVVLNFDEIL